MSWKNQKSVLKADIAKAFEKAYLQMGDNSKGIDWFFKKPCDTVDLKEKLGV